MNAPLQPDPLWYKDAIIYQLHVKAFFDSNRDGIGDLQGLTAKLDYLASLGINTLWLLPFYPSPMRDDGYDIADYRDIYPAYGTLEDFKEFIREAHQRGLRVITELVINHTSDQHPWFQRARLAAPGTVERDYYVWNDDDKKFPETRIIFTDTEISNWAWDPVAKQYYWHRFFSHQPDLNYGNPKVLEEVIEIMYFWLDMGVDGLRLDAIPYLCVREGTYNENLPETHEIIRKIRAALDARYENRLLLAEANQWPEDVQEYFGRDPETGLGNECHMAFHFPLMPRIYMAVAQEDRHPITDILYQTPEIPANCQWAMFLRNHDELTLEMVTDRERDYLWKYYAADVRARVNIGIRRRLSPLMENDRRKVELLNALLMSMPGTPIMYYGDEIGMGDNIYLGDRNSVRTPMQWSPDRNGGFSQVDPARLYLPAIMDPVYGYQSLNVEAQESSPNSLFHWMKQLIAARPAKLFGRGRFRLLRPRNRQVLAYLREYEDETVLCVANLSKRAQPVELDLSEFNGYVPQEMLAASRFPAIGTLPYFLTLAPYGFYWFRLCQHLAPDQAIEKPELQTLVLRRSWIDLFDGVVMTPLLHEILPLFLRKQRWAGMKEAEKLKIALTQRIGDFQLLVLEAHSDAHTRYISLVLGIAWESLTDEPLERLGAQAICKVRQFNRVGVLYEAFSDTAFLHAFFAAIQETGDAALHAFVLGDTAIEPLNANQTNSSARIGDAFIMKLLRQPQAGIQPEEEMLDYLKRQGAFTRIPTLRGALHVQHDMPVTVGLLVDQVPNQGNGWEVTLHYLRETIRDALETQSAEEIFGYYQPLAQQLGKRTAELHAALAKPSSNPAFAPEAITTQDNRIWFERLQEIARQAGQHAPLPLNEHSFAHLLPASPQQQKTRVHGDYHLGQVLVAENDFILLDFEGEPTRALAERRAKHHPMKDVAGMMRSFDYAAATIARELGDAAKPLTEQWRQEATAHFLQGYDCVRALTDEDRQWLRFYLIEKALYEIDYEAKHRADWLEIPIHGLTALLQEEADHARD